MLIIIIYMFTYFNNFEIYILNVVSNVSAHYYLQDTIVLMGLQD